MSRVLSVLLLLCLTLSLLLGAWLGVRGVSSDAAQTGHYRLYAEFTDVGGLAVGSPVSLSGVPVGEVVAIELDIDRYQVIVAMDIRRDVDNLGRDSIALIRTAGLVGERYIDISPGGDPDMLEDGDYFYETQSVLHLERYIRRIIRAWQ